MSVKSSRAFEKDKRFDIPLQFFIVFETFIWIWALIVMSDEVNPKGLWLFSFEKPQTRCDYFGFVLITSFFAAVSIVVGHELFHHKEMHNKIFGCVPAARLMYC